MSSQSLIRLASAETYAQRAAGLQEQARAAADQHVGELVAKMGDLMRLADEVAAGGEVYPAPVRDLARRFADRTAYDGRTLAVLMERAGR